MLFGLIRASHDYLYDHYPDLPELVGEDKQKAEAFVRQRIADWLLQKKFTFGIWENESTDLVGLLQIDHLNWRIPSAEISFFVRPDRAEEIQLLEVVARAVRFAFRQLELEKLTYKVLSDNFAGQRLARKVGFSREGDLRNEFRKGSGTLVDGLRFGLSRETYGE